MNIIAKLFSLLFVLLYLSGCAGNSENSSFAKSVFQTNGASGVREDTDMLMKLLLEYSVKLNKRNPNNYSKEYSKYIIGSIKNHSLSMRLPLLKSNPNATYKEYLNIAFDKKYVQNRSDYLIVGIYKLLYWAYEMDRSYTVTAMQYDLPKVQKANEVMQIVQYRIKTAKDVDGNYLFLTWQRQWQVDLLKKMNKKTLLAQDMSLACYDEKLLLSSSNMSFEVITSNMIFVIQKTLKSLGAEPNNLSASAIKGIFFFL